MQLLKETKLELYGLFCALRTSRLHLIGLPNFDVEVDAKYIQAMINNLDIQPNTAMNQWILIHVPARKHKGPNGLSRRRRVEGVLEENKGNTEEWIDELLELVFTLKSQGVPTDCQLPCTEKDRQMDEQLNKVQIFLSTIQKPAGMSEKEV
ncbi:hypothetical protein K439DRAFT_1639959 [Ramaria rubella]|nr:hypothetical protein K439DRAFT_1639959 [Ramaria rubella]